MRPIEWIIVILIIIGVPIAWVSTKAYFRNARTGKDMATPLFGMLISYGYCLMPGIMVIYFVYTEGIR